MYVLVSCILMIALLAFWRPIDRAIYNLQSPIVRPVMWALFATGWLLVPLASMMINHFDLFGTRQVWLHLQEKAYTYPVFHTPMLYKLVRHPLYVGWIIAFWATPTMTAGHLLFAVSLTAYMLIAIPIEERDLVKQFGQQYVDYRNRVGGLIPRWPTATARPVASRDVA
jgi:protein-S-isoprenylcysteine O-methyltransferase Ste14